MLVHLSIYTVAMVLFTTTLVFGNPKPTISEILNKQNRMFRTHIHELRQLLREKKAEIESLSRSLRKERALFYKRDKKRNRRLAKNNAEIAELNNTLAELVDENQKLFEEKLLVQAESDAYQENANDKADILMKAHQGCGIHYSRNLPPKSNYVHDLTKVFTEAGFDLDEVGAGSLSLEDKFDVAGDVSYRLDGSAIASCELLVLPEFLLHYKNIPEHGVVGFTMIKRLIEGGSAFLTAFTYRGLYDEFGFQLEVSSDGRIFYSVDRHLSSEDYKVEINAEGELLRIVRNPESPLLFGQDVGSDLLDHAIHHRAFILRGMMKKLDLLD